MKSAEQFLEEVVNKPVYYYVYCYYDEGLKTFHQPLVTKDEPEFMLEQIKGSILKKQVDVKNLIDLDLILLGKFDLKSGKFDILDEYQIICECNTFINSQEGVLN